MTRPAARVLTLLALLQSVGVRTMAELADRLGVDGRTVRRYVDHLVDLGVPVESVRGRDGGGGSAAAGPGRMTAMGTASETAAAKIRRVLPSRLARQLDTVLGSLAFTAPAGEFDAP